MSATHQSHQCNRGSITGNTLSGSVDPAVRTQTIHLFPPVHHSFSPVTVCAGPCARVDGVIEPPNFTAQMDDPDVYTKKLLDISRQAQPYIAKCLAARVEAVRPWLRRTDGTAALDAELTDALRAEADAAAAVRAALQSHRTAIARTPTW